MKSFFDDDEYIIDVKSCIDVILYIQAIHPRLGLFMKQAQALATFEDFCFLDKDGEIIDPQTFPFHKFKEDDILYIAPVIVGAGGRSGTFMLLAVVVVAAVMTGGFGLLGAQAAAGGAMPGMVGGATLGGQGGGVLAGTLAGSSISVTSVLTNIAINLALSVVQRLFVAKPDVQRTSNVRDSGTRSQNDMFGALNNTTKADTPICLNYGNMRVAGQFLSGYILSQQHAQNDSPTIASIFNANQSPLSVESEEAA